MPAKPRLADVQCTRMQFQPGDRLLVRVHEKIDRESAKKLHKTVSRWAGSGVEVLIVDMTLMDIEKEEQGVKIFGG